MNKINILIKNINFKILFGISLIGNCYQYINNILVNEKLSRLEFKLNYELKKINIYKEFIIYNNLRNNFISYKSEIELYNTFKESGQLYYKKGIKDKYFVYDEEYGEMSFNLPSYLTY